MPAGKGEGVVSKYSCCQEQSGSPGCQLAKVRGQRIIIPQILCLCQLEFPGEVLLKQHSVYLYKIMSHPYKLDGVMSLYSGTSE